MDKPILVLDLNGTLLCRNKNGTLRYTRPYLEEFLQYAYNNFYVMVWTSGTQKKMQPIVEQIFGNDYLLCEWYRDKCVPSQNGKNPWSVCKDVSKIHEIYGNVQVFIIDDSKEKIIGLSEYDTYINIKEFRGEKNDRELLRFLQ